MPKDFEVVSRHAREAAKIYRIDDALKFKLVARRDDL
jgi:hypothetical protein